VRTIGGATYSYDLNGNLLSGGGRTFTWTPDNLPATVTKNGVTESYVYDADGERVAKTVGGVTTPADESAGWHAHARSSGLPTWVAPLRAQTPRTPPPSHHWCAASAVGCP
jgi:YD repeat-containing protein